MSNTSNDIGRFLAQTSTLVTQINEALDITEQNVSGIASMIAPIDAKFSNNYNNFDISNVSVYNELDISGTMSLTANNITFGEGIIKKGIINVDVSNFTDLNPFISNACININATNSKCFGLACRTNNIVGPGVSIEHKNSAGNGVFISTTNISGDSLLISKSNSAGNGVFINTTNISGSSLLISKSNSAGNGVFISTTNICGSSLLIGKSNSAGNGVLINTTNISGDCLYLNASGIGANGINLNVQNSQSKGLSVFANNISGDGINLNVQNSQSNACQISVTNISGKIMQLNGYSSSTLSIDPSCNITTTGTINGNLIIPITTNINDISGATSTFNKPPFDIPGQCVFYINSIGTPSSNALFIKTNVGSPYQWIGISGTSYIIPS